MGNPDPIFDKSPHKLALAVLAGGRSKRMGQDKALMPFLGRPLIERVLERLSGLAEETIVTTNRPEQYGFLGLPLYPDLLPERGPLGGLYSSLSAVHLPLMAAVACDMPFASRAIFEYELELLVRNGLDAVLPNGLRGTEPLHALYRRETCLPAVRAALEAGERKVISWLPQVKVQYISAAELAQIDPLDLAFLNLNTPEAFLQAEQRASQDEDRSFV